MAGKYILDQNGARIQSILDFFEGYTFTTTNFPQYCSNLINANGAIDGNKTFNGRINFNTPIYLQNTVSLYSTNDHGLQVMDEISHNPLLYTTIDFFQTHTLKPINSNNDIGAQNAYWRDLYLTRYLTDGTNSITIDEIVNDKANKNGPLPSYTVNVNDNVVNFITNNNINEKPIIIYFGNTPFFATLSYRPNSINFELEQCDYGAPDVRYSGTISGATDKVFSDLINNTYKHSYELEEHKVTSLSSDSTDNQYPSAKAVYNFVKPLVEITWSELKYLRDNSQLIPGKFYRITDYNYSSKTTAFISANHVFDIIVRADSIDNLNEEASAIQHAEDTYFANNNLQAWKLWYCLDNDATRFDWADSEAGKGVIYRMIDEFGNDYPHDFKNRLITLWGHTNSYTFNYVENNVNKDASLLSDNRSSKQCCNNVVKGQWIWTGTGSHGSLQGSTTIFYSGDSTSNWCSNYVEGRARFGKQCNKNIILTATSSSLSTFGDGCSANIIKSDCTFGDNCSSNHILGGHIETGDYCSQIISFGSNIIFPDYCKDITIDSGASYLRLTSSTQGSISNYLKNIHIYSGVAQVQQPGPSSYKTITVNRNLAYETNIVPVGTTTIEV